ncbi:hypothetical protein [Streptomyces neyagawaensis]|uniref:hypothetical protein n=1 Tax=Streptomyces neyagawaensis TaxID=42238 RepID=UPI0006E28BA5|nr:hypothetical protein [Streptomyces neyagawaensis]MCL6734800.1 hypothetical protein [Streptomyces neyagawaensis]MDE1686534.1 hypothetical protein [Streptomyces neyagawaensis]
MTPTPAQGHQISLAKPDSSLVTALLVAVAVLLVLFLLLRHVVRKRGGWRRFRRGVARELALTRRAFGEPLRAFRRHRRGVRALSRHLCDPRSGLLVRRLLDAAAAALGDVPGAFAYGLRTEPGWAAVQIAARRLPDPPAPWEVEDELGGQSWCLSLDDEESLPDATPRAGARVRPLPVAVGVADDLCVHLDLAAGPRMITVEGDAATRSRLLQALAAQLDRPGSGASVTVADGVHPHYHGEPLDSVLRRLGDTPSPATGDEAVAATITVVVCAAPTREQARRLSALAATGTVVCLADGPAAGHSWALRVSGRGRVTAPELDLYADSAPLVRAVAAAVRADRRRARRAPARQSPIESAAEPRREPEQRASGTAEPPDSSPLSELVEEVRYPAIAPARTVAGSDLLSEPATARSRSAEASSTGGE